MNVRRNLDILMLRLRSLLVRTRVERDLDRELAFHLDQETQENITKGMSREDARIAAIRRLGGFTQVQEECRDMRRTNQLETIWNDLRYATRTLIRTPGFTLILVLTMALSIGANSAIFSVIQGVLLRPLPYPEPDRLVRIHFSSDAHLKFPLNPFDLRDLRTRNRAFESIAGIVRADAQLSGTSEPVMLRAFRVTAGYFKLLGFSPARGRDFSTDDELPERGRLAIFSDHLWRTRFASDPNIIGRTITINSQAFTVVGVMPPNVQHPGNDYHALADGDTVDLWFPFTFEGNPTRRGSHYIEAAGRLKPGFTVEQANTDLSTMLAQLMKENTGDGWRVFAVPLYQEMVGRTQQMLFVLLGAVGLLLLIACVNSANLLLARSSARVREIAVRSALGAARTRIVRQLLTESLLIALCGAALGTLFAVGGVRALAACLPPGFPRAAEIRLDSTVFAFTLLVGVLTGLLFGLVPALTASHTDLQQSLRDGGRSSTAGTRQLRLRNFLVVGETGLACVLLIAAGLMLHSFVNLLRTDPGFRPQQVLTASISLPYAQYKTGAQVNQLYERLIANLAELPSVHSAGIGTDLPWTGYNENTGFSVEGRSESYNAKTTGRYHVASIDYFRSIGIPLIKGRFFDAHDNKDALPVIAINETMARRCWPGEDAVGKRITFSSKPTEKDWMRVVGVVGDVKDRPDSKGAEPAFWWPLGQMLFTIRNMSVVIRSNADTSALTSQLRLALNQLDPALAIADVRLMNQIAKESVAGQRFTLSLIGLFALLALLLATFGMFSVISYSVNQRMNEFGMRIALGAKPGDLLRMVVGQGLRLSAVGAAIGLICAAGLTRLMGSMLYDVNRTDPTTFAAVALLALITTTVACYLPARRASDTDPIRSLRSE